MVPPRSRAGLEAWTAVRAPTGVSLESLAAVGVQTGAVAPVTVPLAAAAVVVVEVVVVVVVLVVVLVLVLVVAVPGPHSAAPPHLPSLPPP